MRMDEYINREYAVDAVLDVYYDTPDIDLSGEKFEAAIFRIPPADVAPVRHGRWERDEWGSYLRRCSVCKKTPIYKDERGNSAAVYAGICINCGARMDGDWNV